MADYLLDLAEKAKKASEDLKLITSKQIDEALFAMADQIEKKSKNCKGSCTH